MQAAARCVRGALVVAVILGGSTGGAAAVGVQDADAASMDVFCVKGGSGGLQAAIDSARSGATIRVRGACIGNFSIPGAGSATSLTLQGVGGATLDGAGVARTLSIAGGVVVTIRDLGVTGGNAFEEEGGGVGVVSSTLRLERSSVYGNSACFGGGVAISTSSGTIKDSIVRDNIATCAEGGGGGGGVEVDFDSSALIVNTILSRNTARGGPDDIGAGGGLDVFHSTATVADSTVLGNTSGGSGGGISDSFGSTLRLRGTTIRDNQAQGLSGGGLFLDAANATVSGSIFTRNTAKFAAGAIFNLSDVPEEDVSGDSSLKLDTTTITRNQAMLEGGGAILNWATEGTSATISATSTTAADNTAAASGGGIWNLASGGSTANLSLSRSIVRGNTAALGGGIDNAATDDSTATTSIVRETIVTANLATTDGGGVNNEPGPGARITISTGARVVGNRPNNCIGCAQPH